MCARCVCAVYACVGMVVVRLQAKVTRRGDENAREGVGEVTKWSDENAREGVGEVTKWSDENAWEGVGEVTKWSDEKALEGVDEVTKWSDERNRSKIYGNHSKTYQSGVLRRPENAPKSMEIVARRIKVESCGALKSPQNPWQS